MRPTNLSTADGKGAAAMVRKSRCSLRLRRLFRFFPTLLRNLLLLLSFAHNETALKRTGPVIPSWE